ncbi:MAG: hypothetical protein ACI37U_03485 [Bacteroides sp.]
MKRFDERHDIALLTRMNLLYDRNIVPLFIYAPHIPHFPKYI